jgi:N-acetylglucosaminyldiphosphoundecaprenol N-acetyl-beta-D-mannosaminyltransferase
MAKGSSPSSPTDHPVSPAGLATGASPAPQVAPGIVPFVGELPEAAGLVIERALSGAGGYVCLLNVHLFVSARHDARLSSVLQTAALVFPDGWPVAWLQRRLGATTARRVPGPDLMPAVISAGRGRGLRHFLYGSTPAVIDSLQAQLEAAFPDAAVAGAYAPPFGTRTAADELDDVQRIRLASPNVVWCALGSPKQELWAARNAEALAPAIVVGIGAAFDFLAKNKLRAPQGWQRLGLEWLHRLASEPRRLAWRYIRTNPEFAAVALREVSRRRRNPRS